MDFYLTDLRRIALRAFCRMRARDGALTAFECVLYRHADVIFAAADWPGANKRAVRRWERMLPRVNDVRMCALTFITFLLAQSRLASHAAHGALCTTCLCRDTYFLSAWNRDAPGARTRMVRFCHDNGMTAEDRLVRARRKEGAWARRAAECLSLLALLHSPHKSRAFFLPPLCQPAAPVPYRHTQISVCPYKQADLPRVRRITALEAALLTRLACALETHKDTVRALREAAARAYMQRNPPVLTVRTPDPCLDEKLNVWLPYLSGRHTGAARLYRRFMHTLLGLRLYGGAVALAPALPPHWAGMSATLRIPHYAPMHITVFRGDAPRMTVGGREVICDAVALSKRSAVIVECVIV
ncbi:MAG: hypothetical protein LBM78_02020 [Clostridiales bacterium]|jgi:hypothetical protein|nr:hypothetical protein [Clostridiales bacterium]